MTFRLVFIVSSPSAPPRGELVDDVFYVNAPEGYHNLAHKAKHMMGLVRGAFCHSNGVLHAIVMERGVFRCLVLWLT